MEIGEIQERIRREEYEISFHAEKERYAEDITIHDLETAVYNGEILGDYPDDPRGQVVWFSVIHKIGQSILFVVIPPQNGLE